MNEPQALQPNPPAAPGAPPTSPTSSQAQSPPTGKRRSPAWRVVKTLLFLAILGGGTAGGFFYYKKVKLEKEAAAKKQAEERKKPRATLVRVTKARTARVARRERYVGELVALRTVQLAPKTAGRLVRVDKEVGQRVAAGEVVARIDDVEIVKQVEEAKTAIEVMRAQVLRAEAELSRAVAEAERKRPLFKQELVTRQEMENLDAAVDVAKANVKLAKAQVVQAQARIPTLQVQLENTRVTASFGGRVNKRYLDPGAMVTPASPIYEIISDSLLARFKVPERDLHQVPVGKKVTMLIEAYPSDTFAGKIIRVAPAVEAATRTAIADAVVKDSKRRLKPGMFARVDVLWSVETNVILIPQRAVVRPPDDPQGQPGVVVKERDVARFVPVQLGLEEADEVQVRGISAGAEVIVEGQHGLKTGQLVALATDAPKGAGPGGASAPGTQPPPGTGPALPPGGAPEAPKVEAPPKGSPPAASKPSSPKG